VTIALILVTVAFLVTLFLLVRAKGPAQTALAPTRQVESDRSRQLENELDKRRKELEENRRQLNELKEELKQAKRKLFEQKESEKDTRDLAKARIEVERSASVQLEAVRAELAAVYAELDRVKADAARARKPVEAIPVAPTVAGAPVAAPVVEEKPKVQRVIRELSEADKEKMNRLEHDAKRERARTVELERDLKKVKSRADSQNRLFVVMKGELDLLKDKYKAVEKRMNRTLLANDLLRRAIRDLEKKTGIRADRTEPNEEELAASDRAVDERAQAEAEAQASSQAAAEKAEKAAESAAEASAAEQPVSEQPAAEPAAEATAAAEPTGSEPSTTGEPVRA
jgi:hypothetical protein